MTSAFTKAGDYGTTGLIDGTRVKKSAQSLLLFLGKMDELNVYIGQFKYSLQQMVDCQEYQIELNDNYDLLEKIQHFNMDLMGHIQKPTIVRINENVILEKIEHHTNIHHSQLPKLTKFVIPGESIEDVYAHFARVVVRECELYFNDYVSQNPGEQIVGQKYLNRLSSYFFVLARYVNDIRHLDEKKHYRENK